MCEAEKGLFSFSEKQVADRQWESAVQDFSAFKAVQTTTVSVHIIFLNVTHMTTSAASISSPCPHTKS